MPIIEKFTTPPTCTIGDRFTNLPNFKLARLTQGFWNQRNIKLIAGGVLLVAVAAIAMSCLLFIPGAPLAFAGAGIAGFIATKLGISFAAGIALSTAVMTGLPPVLAAGVALLVQNKRDSYELPEIKDRVNPELNQHTPLFSADDRATTISDF